MSSCQHDNANSNDEEISGDVNWYLSTEGMPFFMHMSKDELHEKLYGTELNISEEVKERVNLINGEFEAVIYMGEGAPYLLINQLQEALFNSTGNSSSTIDFDNAYFSLLQEFGSELYTINEENVNDLFPAFEVDISSFTDIYEIYHYVGDSALCVGIFYFDIEGERYFLFCYDSGGSFGQYHLEIVEANAERNVVANFDTQNNGFGKVIKFEEEFYYVFLQYNYNLKNYDTIKIHKLGLHADIDTVSIRYIPNEYITQVVYENISLEEQNEIVLYLEEIKRGLLLNYLESGKPDDYMDIYIGDEEELFDDNERPYYSIDMENNENNIYFYKNIKIPSTYRQSLHMNIEFFLYDSVNEEIINLSQMSYIQDGFDFENQLIQMWFKEINGSVYTFQIYHLFDYNYVLRVLLIEDGEIKEVRKKLLIPKRKFEVIEGVKFVYN